MCWSQLTPPFSPEIIPIRLDPATATSWPSSSTRLHPPARHAQPGQQGLVRLEGQNQAPDWYRLRDLFAEQAPSYADTQPATSGPRHLHPPGPYPDGPRPARPAAPHRAPRTPLPDHRPHPRRRHSPPSTATKPPSPAPGLLTWSEIWCDVDNSKRFRSSRDDRVSPGHRIKGGSALHNSLASIFTALGVTTWSDMSGNTGKNQVTRLVTLRHRSTMSGALGTGSALSSLMHEMASNAFDARGWELERPRQRPAIQRTLARTRPPRRPCADRSPHPCRDLTAGR